MRAPSRSTAAIIAAVLAACGGAVSVAPSDDEQATPANDAEGGTTSTEASAMDTATPLADVAPIDASIPPWDGGPCPPVDDPYWDGVFERVPGSGYTGMTTWGDAAVCGVYDIGKVDLSAQVNGDLACVLEWMKWSWTESNSYPWSDAACPAAICATQSFDKGTPCTVNLPYENGVRTRILDDAGNCIVSSDASFNVGCGQAGRRPNCFEEPVVRNRNPAATTLARQAMLEAASVTAFEELADELRSFGAPSALVDACRVAAHEEAEHARITTALATRFGAHVPDANVSHAPRRTLEECATDNAVEGLVRETFAAAIALHQARSAAPELRTDLARIARDELSHADLSRGIHAWALTALDEDARAAVVRAMREAIEELASELAVASGLDSPALRAIGMPDRSTARRMFDALSVSIWRAELAALA